MKNYKPVVLIASHHRQEITAQNIAALNTQTPRPEIVLIVSEEHEYIYFKDRLPNLHVYNYPNKPLGSKWQFGVNRCRDLGADPLIITGSDDVLGRDFIKNSLRLLDLGYLFIGLRRWFVYDPSKGKAYLFDYTPQQPLGGGRVYTSKLLEKCGWQIFEAKEKLLDDRGWQVAKREKNILVTDIDGKGLYIIAIKGAWETMNPLEKHFGHVNTKLLSEWDAEHIKNLIPNII